ncbi:MAG: M23 family metallopeptidase [Pyrinomonadaceae bacterium]|nr:M23 family metallopeptidase [Pyrinomonadaceae bacterium]
MRFLGMSSAGEPSAQSTEPAVEMVPAAPPTPAPIPSATLLPTPLAEIEPGLNSDEATVPALTSSPGEPSGSGALLVPVVGVRPEQLQDTYADARSEGRVHNAIDIMAPRGTPVLAAADGRIVKLFNSERGGITIYQLDQNEKTVYYYAHLDRYADNLTEGHLARRGEVIGYVGDTGNAGPGNFHLHFSVSVISDPKQFMNGVNINPYPLLRPGVP